MITKDAIETAYSFFHQKLRVYEHSTIDSQKDDIEYAISSYVASMSEELYGILSEERKDFLANHGTFGDDLAHAVDTLERML